MDKSSLFSIGEVSKMFHLSAGSLRHYEALGIFVPEYIDPQTNYRYYSARQFEILNTVRYLRALDMPLPQIADFLKNRDIDVIEEKLLMQKHRVMQKKKELENVEKKIDNRLNQIRDAQSSELDVIKLSLEPPCRLIIIKNSTRLKSLEAIETSVSRISESEDEPVVFLGKVGFGISEENISNGIFDRYDCVFLVIEDEDNYSGEAENLPEALCVSVRFCGVHNDAAQRYEQLTEYMKKNGLRAAGFSREITLVDYGMTNDTKKFVTEIKIPVVPKDWFEKNFKNFSNYLLTE